MSMFSVFLIFVYFFILISISYFDSKNHKNIFEKENRRLNNKLKNLHNNPPKHELSPIEIIKRTRPLIEDIKIAHSAAEGEMRINLGKIVTSIEKVKLGVFENVNCFPMVRRMFEYYIPQTMKIINIRGLARSNNDKDRINQTDIILYKLQRIYGEFEKSIDFNDLKSIEIDIKLLENSLSEDLNFIEITSVKQMK